MGVKARTIVMHSFFRSSTNCHNLSGQSNIFGTSRREFFFDRRKLQIFGTFHLQWILFLGVYEIFSLLDPFWLGLIKLSFLWKLLF